MHPLVEGALFAGALPAALGAGLLAGTLALSKSGTACRWRGGVAVGLPFLISGVALGSGLGVPDGGIAWIPFLAVLGALAPRLMATSAARGLGLGFAFAAAATAVIAQNKLRFAWSPPVAAFVIGAWALTWVAWTAVVARLPAQLRGRGARGELPALVGVTAAIGASAPIWGIAGSLSLAQASGVLATLGGVLCVFTWARPAAEVPRATLPALAALWGAVIVGGCLLTYELPLWVPLGFALVPLSLAALDRGPLRRAPLPLAIGVAALAGALPVGGVVAILSAPEPEAAPADDDPYAGYEDWSPSGE